MKDYLEMRIQVEKGELLDMEVKMMMMKMMIKEEEEEEEEEVLVTGCRLHRMIFIKHRIQMRLKD